jgi:hypothetical protein
MLHPVTIAPDEQREIEAAARAEWREQEETRRRGW